MSAVTIMLRRCQGSILSVTSDSSYVYHNLRKFIIEDLKESVVLISIYDAFVHKAFSGDYVRCYKQIEQKGIEELAHSCCHDSGMVSWYLSLAR